MIDAIGEWMFDHIVFLSIMLVLFIVIGIPALAASVQWYKAGVQADVYRREGIEMSQWDVFMGAKPAERAIQIKGGK